MKLRPEEYELIGRWIVSGGSATGDAVEDHINRLIASHLQKVAISRELGAWEVLYRDPTDGRYWELTYPQGEMHGGGPKRLTCIARKVAAAKYDLTQG
jgi:Immunity protein 27